MSDDRPHIYRRVITVACAAAAFLFCLYCLWISVIVGYSRLLTAQASNPVKYNFINIDQLQAAETAARLTPSDAEAHLIRGLILQSRNEMGEAVRALEQAAALRPLDYVTWLELGILREQAGDTEGAIAACREAVRLAPYYAKPRWFLGNIQLRAGRFDEAFAEMSRAAASNPIFLPQLIDLAWGIYQGDVRKIEGLIPQTPAARLALARGAARRGKTSEVARIFRTIEVVSEQDRRALVTDLLTAKQFTLGYEVWSGGPKTGALNSGRGFINGGFEEQIIFDETGFGWRIMRQLPKLQISIDRAEPREGSSSLRLDWSGDSNPASPVVSQLLLVEPGVRYRLRFAARAAKLVTGGLPVIAVLDPHGDEARELAHSKPLPQPTSSWQDYDVEFTTERDAQAVLIILRREGCNGAPCPVFGSLWLDNFSLEKV